jgi:ribonuclease HI
MRKIIINTDGGARGNPGPAGIGVVMVDEGGLLLKEFGEYIGETTNNVAEYQALIRALEETQKLLGTNAEVPVEIRMDSELVVRQMEGRYKVKEPTLKLKFLRVKELLQKIPATSFVHVRREQNKRADELVNEAIDARVN